jgi:hypothetical protein
MSSNDLFRHFKTRTNILKKAQEFVNGVDDWESTSKYSFYHTPFPMDLVREDPYLYWLFETFGEIQPWVLMVPPNVMFDFHTDQSKGAAVNFAVFPRSGGVTLFKHSKYKKRFQDIVYGCEYGADGRFTLLNNMKQHSVINYSNEPFYTLTIPLKLNKPDFVNIFDELETPEYTYRIDSNLKMPSVDQLTPQHLEIIIFNKCLRMMVAGGFDLVS